jgi:hypothetical protein
VAIPAEALCPASPLNRKLSDLRTAAACIGRHQEIQKGNRRFIFTAGRALVCKHGIDGTSIRNDRKTRELAAEAWCEWEDVIVSLNPGAQPSARFADPNFRVLFATLVIHYFANSAFLEGHEILQNIERIVDLPGVLIHGRLDISGPLQTAWQLHQRWSNSRLLVIETEGHGGAVMWNEFTKAIAGFS